MNTKTNQVSNRFNRYGYITFVIAGIFFSCITQFSEAGMFLGLALVFDPFDITVAFYKRPYWQRAWLTLHLLATMAAFLLMIL